MDPYNGPYCHMEMTQAPDFSVALRDGLNQVMSAVFGCKYDIPVASADGVHPVDIDRISPIIRFSDGRAILVGKDSTGSASCSDGFRLIGNTQMELC